MSIFSFLNALERVTAPGYLPTDGTIFILHHVGNTDGLLPSQDDILRARLKTLGMANLMS